MNYFKLSSASIPSLEPVSDEQSDEIQQFLKAVRDEIVPAIDKDVEARYKNAELARALFLR